MNRETGIGDANSIGNNRSKIHGGQDCDACNRAAVNSGDFDGGRVWGKAGE